jgi:hypothetical protein
VGPVGWLPAEEAAAADSDDDDASAAPGTVVEEEAEDEDEMNADEGGVEAMRRRAVGRDGGRETCLSVRNAADGRRSGRSRKDGVAPPRSGSRRGRSRTFVARRRRAAEVDDDDVDKIDGIKKQREGSDREEVKRTRGSNNFNTARKAERSPELLFIDLGG